MLRITGVDVAVHASFHRDMKKLPPDIRAEANRRIAGLVGQPLPRAWRFHRLHGHCPNIYCIDVWRQKAYKASFNIEDGIAVMRRVGRHRLIDRDP